jgi:uncharacterized protein (TIGR02145 family)
MIKLLPLLLLACLAACNFLKSEPVQQVSYGTMTDPRDGQSYRTLKYNGLNWMVQSLNLRLPDGMCNDVVRLCLYSKKQIMDSLGMRLCPSGWHMPTIVEWARSFHDAKGELNAEPFAFVNYYPRHDSALRMINPDSNKISNGFGLYSYYSGGPFTLALRSQDCPERISTVEITGMRKYDADFYGTIYHGDSLIDCEDTVLAVNNESKSSFGTWYVPYVDDSAGMKYQVRCVQD